MAEQALEPLLAELRNMIDRVDPLPPDVLAAAKASFVWRTIDAELAELAADSLDDGLVGVRANGAARLLTFEAPGVEVEVEVADVGQTRRLTGQLVPPSAASITLQRADGTQETTADDMGRFTFEGVPAATVRLEILQPGASHPVVTSWVAI